MPRNGIGSYALPAGNPVVTGTTISSSTMNTTLSDIAAALTQSVSSDGQTPFTGPIQLFSGTTLSSSATSYVSNTTIPTTGYLDSFYVQMGTGIGQLTNKVKIGWSGALLLATVDASALGSIGMSTYDNTWIARQTFNGGVTLQIGSLNNILGTTSIYTGGSALGAPTLSYINSNGLKMGMTVGTSGGLYWANNANTANPMVLTDGGALSVQTSISAPLITQTSDERLKENWRTSPENLVSRMATVQSGVYDLKAGTKDLIGVSAQELQAVMPQAIANDEQGYLSVNYGAASLVSVIELCKEVVLLRARLAALEAK